MRIRHTLYLAALLLSTSAPAQRLEVISMDHIGGEKTDAPNPPGVVTHPNGNFSFTVASSSTTGSINTTCIPDGLLGASILLTYDNNYSPLGQFCAPKVLPFVGQSTFYFYPQPNGDTVFIGLYDVVGYDIGLQRRDASGNVLWTKVYGGSGGEGIASIAPLADGGFLILAGTNSDDGDVGLHYGSEFTTDIWLLRVDANGDKLWAEVLGGTESEVPTTVITASDGGSYVFASSNSADHDISCQLGGADIIVIKLDSGGNIQWIKCLGGTQYDGRPKAIADGFGGFYVLAQTESQDGHVQQRMPMGYDFWLLHIDSLANIIWENTFGGPGYEVPAAFCRGADGSLWMGGDTQGSDTPGGMIDVVYGGDCWVAHADSLGQFLNQRVLGTNVEEYLTAMYALPDGTVVAAGRYRKNGNPGPSSPGFPQTTEGSWDIFMAHLGPHTVAIAEKEIPFGTWEVFPNPAGKQVTVRVAAAQKQQYTLTVTDVSGASRYHKTFGDQLQIDTKSWPPGTYLFQLNTADGRKRCRKVILRH